MTACGCYHHQRDNGAFYETKHGETHTGEIHTFFGILFIQEKVHEFTTDDNQ
jgi:hypothetical protein